VTVVWHAKDAVRELYAHADEERGCVDRRAHPVDGRSHPSARGPIARANAVTLA